MKNKIEKIIASLKSQKQTITFAESCTGGRIAAAFTSVSGASAILDGSCVTYSNEIKQLWLGVKEETLIAHGAVSPQCVSQMLEGMQRLAGSDYTIAVSGIAGPGGASDEKPVGTVYIGIQSPFTQEIFHCFFHGNREQIQEQSSTFAIDKLMEVLEI